MDAILSKNTKTDYFLPQPSNVFSVFDRVVYRMVEDKEEESRRWNRSKEISVRWSQHGIPGMWSWYKKCWIMQCIFFKRTSFFWCDWSNDIIRDMIMVPWHFFFFPLLLSLSHFSSSSREKRNIRNRVMLSQSQSQSPSLSPSLLGTLSKHKSSM